MARKIALAFIVLAGVVGGACAVATLTAPRAAACTYGNC